MSDHRSTTPPPPPGWDPAQGPPPAPQPGPEPTRRKSWFARHKILTGILAVLAVFVVGGALSGGDDAPSTAAQTSAEPAHASAGEGTDPSASSPGSTADGSAAEEKDSEDEAGDEQAAEDEAAKEEAKKEEAKEEQAAAPGVGDTVEVGDFAVRVTDVEPGVEWVGDPTFGEGPQGQFVKVYVTVENTGSEAEYFLDSDQKLVDDEDRQHSTSSAAWLLDEENLFLTEINPGNKVEGVLLYDVPVDAVPVALDLQAGWLGDPVRVSIGG